MRSRLCFHGPELELRVQATELGFDPDRIVLQHPNKVGKLRYDPGANLLELAQVWSGPSVPKTSLERRDVLLPGGDSAYEAAR